MKSARLDRSEPRSVIVLAYRVSRNNGCDGLNHGIEGRASALFDLAIEIEDQLSDLSEALENIEETTAKLTNLQPESRQCGD